MLQRLIPSCLLSKEKESLQKLDTQADVSDSISTKAKKLTKK